MDIKDKIIDALRSELSAEYIRVEDDGGISGFVVSRAFENVSTFDRQTLIENALVSAALTKEESRQVLMIAGLTPEEYATVGARIRVHKVREKAGGVLEILLHGGPSDAQYVRGALNNQKGVNTTEPKSVAGALGILMSFLASGTKEHQLTKEKTVRVLKKDPYIHVMPNA